MLQIAWAVTNLAAAEHEIVKAVLVSAPALIAHLSGWLSSPVAEQCAWALGKIYKFALQEGVVLRIFHCRIDC